MIVSRNHASQLLIGSTLYVIELTDIETAVMIVDPAYFDFAVSGDLIGIAA